jgi:16S rRNA (guanine966-N2)-methyltransferase
VQQQKQLRISSGSAKNKKLKTPNLPNFRPVQEVAKQAVFAILGESVNEAKCLDLFAGSGNMGIEALSRGADWCDFVDSNYEATKVIEENLFSTGFSDRSEVFLRDAVKYVQLVNQQEPDKKYDIILIDPFYDDTAQVHLLKTLPNIMDTSSIAILFFGKNLNLKETIKDTGLTLQTVRRFGASYFAVLKVTR